MIDLEGAILTGGQSRRMGRDKSTLVLGEMTMVERVAAAMTPITSRVRLVGGFAGGTGSWTVQPDLRPGLGPLSGIHAALTTAAAPAVIVVACDLPLVTTRLLCALIEQLSSGIDAVVPRLAGRAIPVCAVYRTSCVAAVNECLDRGELKAHRFVDALKTHFVEDEALARLDPEGLGLSNINTPSDLADAAAKLR